ncbi:MAG: hypothetical protein LC808_36140 [Actinobacteria bacterium]|nr:hypothetical protein [Actinomycetota bacterium]
MRDCVRDEIQHLSDDDSRLVSAAAAARLRSILPQPHERPNQQVPPDVSEPASEKITEPRTTWTTPPPARQAVSSVPGVASARPLDLTFSTAEPPTQTAIELQPPSAAIGSGFALTSTLVQTCLAIVGTGAVFGLEVGLMLALGYYDFLQPALMLGAAAGLLTAIEAVARPPRIPPGLVGGITLGVIFMILGVATSEATSEFAIVLGAGLSIGVAFGLATVLVSLLILRSRRVGATLGGVLNIAAISLFAVAGSNLSVIGSITLGFAAGCLSGLVASIGRTTRT